MTVPRDPSAHLHGVCVPLAAREERKTDMSWRVTLTGTETGNEYIFKLDAPLRRL